MDMGALWHDAVAMNGSQLQYFPVSLPFLLIFWGLLIVLICLSRQAVPAYGQEEDLFSGSWWPLFQDTLTLAGYSHELVE